MTQSARSESGVSATRSDRLPRTSLRLLERTAIAGQYREPILGEGLPASSEGQERTSPPRDDWPHRGGAGRARD